jgi:hypothetical protein
MKIKRMVKRLFAVASGATMLGATAMGALAADLNNYPNDFVTDGTFDGFFVVGEAAASVDNLAMTDIAASMKVAGGGSSSVTVSGDAWMVGTSAKKFELSNTNSTVTGEQIRDIESFISKGELGALADGSYNAGGTGSSYQQYLYFDTANNDQNEIVKYVENDKDVTADFFFVKNGESIGEYVLEFSSAPESTIQNTAGSASTTGAVLDDFETTSIMMLGKSYDIVLARRSSSAKTHSIKLTMMGGSATGSLLEGESTSVTALDKEYDVTLSYTDATYAKFTVNGEATDKLQKGDTFKLADGNEIGVSEILYQSYAGGVHSATFFVGASKVELTDSNVTTLGLGESTLKVGSESISGAVVQIEGSDDDTTYTLTKIRVNMTAQDDYFVPAGGKLSDAIVEQGDDKELLFTNNWDIEYKGLTDVPTHEIKILSSTDRKYKLQWYDGDNNMVQMPFAYAVNNTHIQFSEDASDKEVILNEGLNVSKNDYFAVTGGSATSGTAKSYALQYKGADKSTATSPKIKFKNLGSGETLEYALDTDTASGTIATIKLGGYSFAVTTDAPASKSSADVVVNVALDGTLTASGQELDIVDYSGVTIDFGNGLAGNFSEVNASVTNMLQPTKTNVSSVDVTFKYEYSSDYDDFKPANIVATIDAAATNEVRITTLNSGGSSNPGITPEGVENIVYGYNSFGGKWSFTSPSSSPHELTLEAPETQRLPQLYVTSGSVTTASSNSGSLVAVTVVDATKLDSEVSDVKAQNLIVVGGPCVNTAAAKLMGNPSDCTEGFTPGKARVKLFTNGDKVAMLVAGYSGADTRLAGKVVANRAGELSGEEVEIEGTTYSDATIGAPTVVEAVVEKAMEETTTE